MNSKTLLFTVPLFLIACGQEPASSSPGDDRVVTSQSIPTSIDREISDLENAIEDEDPSVIADLDARIARNRDLIAELNLEASLQRGSQDDELAAIREHQDQNLEVLNQRLDLLAGRIREQEKVVARNQEYFATLIAPEESELIRSGRAQVEAAQAILSGLQSEYQALLQQQYEAPIRNYSEQDQILRANRARQEDLLRMVMSIQSDVSRILQERNSILELQKKRRQDLARLRSEKERAAGATP